MAEPERFVEPDPELPLALLDQKRFTPVILRSHDPFENYSHYTYVLND
jgi:hypothetical protein